MNHSADLHIPFLNKVLQKLRDIPLGGDIANSWIFYEFVPAEYKANQSKTRLFVREHLEYLQAIALLELSGKNMYHEYLSVKLTAHGRH